MIVFLHCGFLFYHAYEYLNESLFQNILIHEAKQLERPFNKSSEILDNFFDTQVQKIISITNDASFDHMDYKKFLPFIKEKLKEDKTFEKFIVGTPKGEFYNTHGGNPHFNMIRTFDDTSEDTRPRSIRRRDYWKQTVGSNEQHKKKIFISSPMISYTTSVKQIVVAASIVRDGRVVGMVGGSLSWDIMKPFLIDLKNNFSHPERIYLSLIAPNGTYWYHWDRAKIIHPLKNFQGNNILDNFGENVAVSSFVQYDKNDSVALIGREVLKGKRGFETFEHNDKRYSAFYGKLDNSGYALIAASYTPKEESILLAILFVLLSIFLTELVVYFLKRGLL
ncbi:cache domain-containing protein [Halobacteriovorax sp. GB3]|uniref:PDC sensor domain-containing protein n=1 Tax=Halobacteriovorax sp. GB3 TaxID=2719615 RepID=UPI0023625336|nr:cache domain-containing protein [Halobacteriovorax sp. GB3]MDD0853194.1 cache domain-containing protein [Halobacteriovorax sp. GB3]